MPCAWIVWISSSLGILLNTLSVMKPIEGLSLRHHYEFTQIVLTEQNTQANFEISKSKSYEQ